MQTPQFTFSDLPLKPEQKEGEIDYSDAKVSFSALTPSDTATDMNQSSAWMCVTEPSLDANSRPREPLLNKAIVFCNC